tara:strand:+ start:1824 stop:2552 length:729 start_codon:yes stop_codon:yes gene_type:complete
MSNRIRKLKSKAMYAPGTVNNGFSSGGQGSNILSRKYKSNNRLHTINYSGKGPHLTMTNRGVVNQTCCANTTTVSKPVIHYSYRTYMQKKYKGCYDIPGGSKCDISSNSIYKRISDIGNGGGSEFYLENKKGKVLLAEEQACGKKKVDVNDGVISCPKNCNNGIILDATRLPADFVKNNNISIGKLHQKSYAQLMAEKKPTVTKTLPFNYASMHIMRKKARRTCGNQKYESAPAKINLAKHA